MKNIKYQYFAYNDWNTITFRKETSNIFFINLQFKKPIKIFLNIS